MDAYGTLMHTRIETLETELKFKNSLIDVKEKLIDTLEAELRKSNTIIDLLKEKVSDEIH